MKPYKIALFIFSVIGVLTCIAAVYPENGIDIAQTNVSFPTLNSMLTPEKPSADTTPEQVATLKIDSILSALDSMQRIEAEPYLRFFKEAPNRIYFPNNDLTFFDALYAALDSAHEKPVRIVHYGDSQIEEDRITKELRLELQSRFGGSGVGLLPFVQNISSQTTRQSSSATLTRKMAYGPTSFRSSDRIYGPLLRMDILNTPTTTTINAKRIVPTDNPAYRFTKATILSRPIGQDITLKVNNRQPISVSPRDNQLTLTPVLFSDTMNQITVSATGYGYMYGIMLDDTVGVSVDNVPMRGCSGTIFTQADPSTMRQYYRLTNTKLIIMQFTGNSVPYLSTKKAVLGYIDKIRNQLRFMKRQAPDAVIMFIGPSDMLQSKDGTKASYPLLPYIDHQMQLAVNEEGVAYWSIFQMMGGSGSMTKWSQATPALAGKDGIHFTRLGAQHTGTKLTEAVMQGYRYYTLRNEFKQIIAEAKSDTLCIE